MELTTKERLLFWNIFEIRKRLSPDDKGYCENVQDALTGGYQPLYDYLFGMSEEQLTQDQADFVYNVLGMYEAFQRYEEDSGQEIGNPIAKFAGFDGHGDLVGFARFNVEKLGRWKYLNIKEFDAHFPIEDMYRRMLSVWLRKEAAQRYNLTRSEVDAILAEAVHPENR